MDDSTETIVNEEYICQVCKHHENKPSRCIRLGMYVSRKKLMPCNEPSKHKMERRAE